MEKPIVIDDKPEMTLFKSAYEALVFAFHFPHQHYHRPLVDRMAGSVVSTGKGLGGVEGAAQAGMIRRALMSLSELHQHLIIACVAPHEWLCHCGAPCCRRQRPNPEWVEALSGLAEQARTILAGHLSHRLFRLSLLRRLFNEKLSLAEVSRQCGIDQDTATAHHAKLRRWIYGEANGRESSAKKGELQRAFEAAQRQLQDVHLIPEETAV
jgi:hypothetical protein